MQVLGDTPHTSIAIGRFHLGLILRQSRLYEAALLELQAALEMMGALQAPELHIATIAHSVGQCLFPPVIIIIIIFFLLFLDSNFLTF